MIRFKSFSKFSFSFLLMLCIWNCKTDLKQENDKLISRKDSLISNTFQEPYRPQFHFSPETKWMNDPNGMVYHKGIYHLFYQYYPEDIVWGPMHWGHATSKDLIYWEHQGIKLFPDEHGYIFSGSVVVDHKNTSGLSPDNDPPLVALFTYHDAEAEKKGEINYQTQGLAFSNDNGVTWEKYKGNPVIGNPGIKDIRDPKVSWYEPTKQWIMTLAVGDHISFYGSKDLINWNKLSDFGKNVGAHGGVWECPDLFPMVENNSGDIKWVLLVSINPGGPNGGSATQYFIGTFDGKKFVPEDKITRWLDYGADNYAGVTFSNAPNNKKIFLGWMSNWDYAQQTPTKVWRSAMTIPRELSLSKENNNYFLNSVPIQQFKNLHLSSEKKNNIKVQGNYTVKQALPEQAEILIETESSNPFSIKLSNDSDDFVLLLIDPVKKIISFDRRQSGLVEFNEKFANKIHTLPINSSDQINDLQIILDRSSIEIFIDHGKYVITEQVFPNKPYSELSFKSEESLTIKKLNINQLKSIWSNE